MDSSEEESCEGLAELGISPLRIQETDHRHEMEDGKTADAGAVLCSAQWRSISADNGRGSIGSALRIRCARQFPS